MQRYRLYNRELNLLVEFATRTEAAAHRKDDHRFRRRKVRDILQLRPSEVKPGRVYVGGGGPLEDAST